MKKLTALLFLALSFNGVLWADSIKVFAASSTKSAMQEIVKEFESKNPNDKLEVTYSATGKAYAQLANGLEYDVFMAADSKYPQKIIQDSLAMGEAKIYALGILALYSYDENLAAKGIDSIKDASVKHISIANPKVAPYGEAAMEILKNYNLEESVKNRLVLGDNIAQSVQFVDTHAAEVGLVAFSLIKKAKKESEYKLIDTTKYTPMEQSFVLTKYAKDKPLAAKFGDFIVSQRAKEIFKEYGFGVK
ncbi:MAG: molybdate ABC transporter substrate-binding protein [Sulfurimonas sp.]|uniref:molybdate ABC transporter substrate-binding protein n=1 Tax=Sulfurimonas sp. TaxID=2022749 RepID=UPI002637D15C|nr:molybdate ABC transporter substrate-binding protein [Sulfurimonas sp.]MDD2652190.1 molybdate ABC transporter substrate-binding protein [Sulfurimonas sp.]MDD3450527.1 molybdate ABC transporter substrate-binding protein [Sulfurimonas sp.]